ncbi:MAG: prepilin-type cleavage/methylation domain-containing protein [Ideonella sp. MAG2]|nr:MAG: prepilin-type cleavage/methylation domain-containing protein [Ideonella sp. MAG2]
MRLPLRHRRTDRPRWAVQQGFTLMELIAVIVIAGVLAVVVLPKFEVATGSGGRVYADSLRAGLRYARAVAVGHRRLVCVDINANSQLLITIAANNPATACTTGIDGNPVFATPPGGVTAAWSAGSTVFVQPNGRFTSDGAGTTPVNKTLNVAGETPIKVEWLGRVE